ncbi:uncharacterized protein I303_105340 [Kwoniella dejecticola CBS 10117]|uniref:Golgi apparatus membrane protein TVP38 n=1 Tax=Kwoniella dejecticola CBS 10117 TaxID=1296121 RepID=A0A1A6A2S1_9TREE|nr:uncharacterized protein I303_05213 [Kwoniella dejecticola CBS 10117]OBR84355.1 hypothetical protein I303_05213 [Kwoniella dejecticola CBS 10117]
MSPNDSAQAFASTASPPTSHPYQNLQPAEYAQQNNQNDHREASINHWQRQDSNGHLDTAASAPARVKSRHSIMHETDEELTEDEKIEYEKGLITWEKAKNWRFWLRKEWIWWYLIFILIVVVVALMAFFHHSIINWLSPFVKKLRELKAGFVIPAAILFVLSFPPLFGNEIVIVLVGLVWGLGKGFAIVVVGVGLGETVLFLLFKHWCRHRAERMTMKSLNYACLSESIRQGGFLMAWVVRLSVIPTHYTTAVLAICGLPTWKFILALLLSTPKQLISVYVGVVLGQTNASTNSHVISDCVFGACALITLGALYFIYNRMIKVRKGVLISMRKDLHKRHVEVPPPPEN